MLFLVGWIVYRQVLWGSTPPVDISIIYAPEAEPFMPQVIEAFNHSFARGINPVTGEALAQNQRPIHVSTSRRTSRAPCAPSTPVRSQLPVATRPSTGIGMA